MSHHNRWHFTIEIFIFYAFLIAHLKLVECNLMELISFLFFHWKLLLILTLATWYQTFHSYSPPPSLFDTDHTEIANLIIVFYLLGDCGQALFIRSCHEDVILTRKSHNFAWTAFVQGDSRGGSKLIERNLLCNFLQWSFAAQINSSMTMATLHFALPLIYRVIFFSLDVFFRFNS